jgi:hypothetical protein
VSFSAMRSVMVLPSAHAIVSAFQRRGCSITVAASRRASCSGYYGAQRGAHLTKSPPTSRM